MLTKGYVKFHVLSRNKSLFLQFKLGLKLILDYTLYIHIYYSTAF